MQLRGHLASLQPHQHLQLALFAASMSRQSSRSRADQELQDGVVQKLDFDANRKRSTSGERPTSSDAGSAQGLLRDDDSLLSDVVQGILKEDRKEMQRRVAKGLSFLAAMMCW